ncbi:outer membrane protein assembly factor BamB family protein [Parachitinimonas caeni]|uniref:PQQ-binding-like beta-propeller repeat protein n=1 Tax=Parachitinimonas caeni TaxID=3031301 RepID=A0ABT7E032_9NEIS|nr:PQQ-binding-like beta-propeller repeat protein [Parachitinimonas caeni]MDK2124703.1 PQQ-binding-like beta-propeller repeat protein [Parachitinimonas caeni]
MSFTPLFKSLGTLMLTLASSLVLAQDWQTYQGNTRYSDYVPVSYTDTKPKLIWEISGRSDILGPSPVIAQEKVFFISYDKDAHRYKINAINLSDGKMSWTSPLDLEDESLPKDNKFSLSFVDGKLYLTGNGVSVYDANNGDKIYSRTAKDLNGNTFSRSIIKHGMIFSMAQDVPNGRNILYANNASNGDEVWSAVLPQSQPEIAIKDDELYIYFNGNLNAYSIYTGEILYQIPHKGNSVFSPLLFGQQGNLLALIDGTAVSFNLKTRSVDWTFAGNYFQMISGKGVVYLRESVYFPDAENLNFHNLVGLEERSARVISYMQIGGCNYDSYSKSELGFAFTDSTLFFPCLAGMYGFKLNKNGALATRDILWKIPETYHPSINIINSTAISDDYLVAFNGGQYARSGVYNTITAFRFEKEFERVNPFEFLPAFNVKSGEWGTSKSITVTGISKPTPVSVVGGEYSINDSAFTNEPGLVNRGDKVRVRARASLLAGDKSIATLSFNDATGTFEVYTTDDFTVPISAAAVGSLKSKTIDVKLNIGEDFAGKGGAIYVLLSHNGALYAYTQKGWAPVSIDEVPHYYWGVLDTTSIRLTSSLDISSIKGANLFVGYGKHLDEMLSAKRYKLVYTVQD